MRLDYDTDLRVTFVPQNENRFYLRRFIGQDYLYGMNRWESAKAIYMRTEQRAKTAFEKNIPAVHMESSRLIMWQQIRDCICRITVFSRIW